MMRLCVLMLGLFSLSCALQAQINTTTTLTSVAPAAPLFGQKVTVSAQVAPAPAPGAVWFTDNNLGVGAGALDVNGFAQMATMSLPAGTHLLRAFYAGASGYSLSLSATVPYIVTPIPGAGFAPAVTYTIGGFPLSAAMGDFNGDGKADLAVANFGGNVSVLLGNGNGTFQAAVNYFTGSGSQAVAVGDLNGDGKADLVVVNNRDNNVSVLLGNGDGTFQGAVNYATGAGPRAVIVGYFHGNGKVDLVVANGRDNNVSVLLGNGDGTFQAAVNYAAAANPQSIAVADFNGDGAADLAVSGDLSNSVTVLKGNGNGTFQAVNYAAGFGPYSIAIGDFNGDGRADMALASPGAAAVIVMLATAPPATSVALQSTPNPSRYGQTVTLTADVTPFNSSGQVEFLDGTTVVGIGTLNLSGRAQISTSLLPSGTRSLQAVYHPVPGVRQPSQSGILSQVVNPMAPSSSPPQGNYATGSGPGSVAVGDFNGDGKADLAITNQAGNTVSVLLGNGTGGFQTAVSYSAGTAPISIAVGDFNGDGKTDLAVANFNVTCTLQLGCRSFVSVLLGNGDGTFQAPQSYVAGANPISIGVGDFNGDGKPDLAVANFNFGVSVLLGNGDGTFQGALTYPAGANPRGVALGDFNGDGKIDVVVANASGSSVSILLGNGNGTLRSAVNYSVKSNPWSVAVSDFDGDGKADLAVASTSGGVSVLLGNGDGTFQAAVNYLAGRAPGSVTTADFNADGKVDLAVVNYSGGSVSVLLGKGDGTFQTSVSYVEGINPISVAVGDFNGDGAAVLAVVNQNSNNVNIGLGARVFTKAGIFRSGFFWLLDANGDRQFTSPSDPAFSFGGIAGDIPVTGDWTGDGHIKVGIYRSSSGLFILDSNGDGQFDAGDVVYDLGVGTEPGDVPVVGDWNGDGRTKVGLFRQGFFWILDYNGNGVFEQDVDKTYAFGGVDGDVPVVGDWSGSGTSKIGLFRQGFFWILDFNGNGTIDNVNQAGGDKAFAYGGISGDVPVVGDWNGGGRSKVGVFRSGYFWVLDANGNFQFDGVGPSQDLAFPFGGVAGDVPVVGNW